MSLGFLVNEELSETANIIKFQRVWTNFVGEKYLAITFITFSENTLQTALIPDEQCGLRANKVIRTVSLLAEQ